MKKGPEDWRKNAELIRARGRECVSEYVRDRTGIKRPDGMDEIYVKDFPAAWFQFAFSHGHDPERFLTPHEGFKRLSPEEQKKCLADLAARCRDAPKNGRPFHGALRQAATVGCYFYDAWRAENQENGINDYGHRSEMKYIAAEAVVEDYFAWMFATPKFAWPKTLSRLSIWWSN
jgi:hypothetical protein